MSDDCIFCKIVRGEIPAERLMENDHVVVFKDIQPAAPIHYLVIPKEHIATMDAATPGHAELMGQICLAAAQAARLLEIAEPGYRLVANTNRDGGQVVYHIHFHLLGGREFRWPPG